MHGIATINGETAMAYVGQTPWHRLGTQTLGFGSVEEAMRAAHLDWKVACEPLFVRHGDSYETLLNRRAVVRDVDRTVLSTVGMDYVPFQNAEAFSVLDEAVSSLGVKIETAGALGRGEKVWMLAKLPKAMEVVKGDKVEGYFLVATSHDGRMPYVAMDTPIRVVCQNTLTLALRSGKSVIKLRHVKSSADRFEEAQKMVTLVAKGFKDQVESYKKLAARKVTRPRLEAYVDRVLGIPEGVPAVGVAGKQRAAILELADSGKGVDFAKGTAWAAFNAVTEYVDHFRLSVKSAKRMKSADESALFGPLAKLKARAFELASVA
jgi:phage/plasmid-like protein (TIGR03299 family)